MHKPYDAAPDVSVLPSYFPIPGLGFLPCNAYVLKSREPVLVDTGLGIDSDEFMDALASVIEPEDLQWIVLTHDDADHLGSIQRVLDAAPDARIATNAVTALRMSTAWQVPMNRLFCLNAGESFSAGDRTLTAFQPPVFDNPATLGFHDSRSGLAFSADLFGAILPSEARDLGEVPEESLTDGMRLWATIDAPWIHFTDRGEYARRLEAVRRMGFRSVCSSHLPPAQGRTEEFLRTLATAPDAQPFVAPNQAALEEIMAGG